MEALDERLDSRYIGANGGALCPRRLGCRGGPSRDLDLPAHRNGPFKNNGMDIRKRCIVEITQVLRNSTLFGNLDTEVLAVVAGQLAPLYYGADELIFREGDLADCYFLIALGDVVLTKGSGIAQREICHLGAGSGFGEMGLVSDEPRSVTVCATVDTRLYRLNRDGFDALIDSEPYFARNVLHLLSGRLRSSDEVASQVLLRAHQGLIMSLSQLAESRDKETGGHLQRVRDYCVLLAKLMARHPLFEAEIDDHFIEALYHVSPLHDIGKVGIRDEVLLKPGKLTEQEYTEMKCHAEIGSRSLETVMQYCQLDMFRVAQNIVRSHHERYDGTGYPDGLTGNAIPLEARIMSLADVYDALRSRRPYKEPMGHEKAMQILLAGTNAAFDPQILPIMMENAAEFARIHDQYDGATGSPE